MEVVSWFEIGWEQTLYLSGDTTINNEDYNKVCQIYGHNLYDTSFSEYLGGIRQDTNDRVYFLPDTNSSFPCLAVDSMEVILYDFNAGIGDTFIHLI